MRKSWKQGDVNPDTGLIFWSKQKSCKNGQRWVSLDKFKIKLAKINEWQKSEKGKRAIAKIRNTDKERAKRNAYAKKWRSSDSRKKHQAEYARNRRKTNKLVAIAERVRARVAEAFRVNGISKKSNTSEIIGCDWNTLVNHLEKNFTNGMSWDNKGDWEIDHIIPLSAASNEKELAILCKFKNMQPMWKSENRKKSNKLPEECLDQAVYLKRAIEELEKR